MNTVEIFVRNYEFNRERTLGLLDVISKNHNPQGALAWRPGPGRAHIGWQLMHIAVTEEIFATERLAPDKPGAWKELWPRFRGGSTPDDNVPSVDQLRDILSQSRQHLLATLAAYGDDRLTEIPPSMKEKGFSVRDVLHVINWHEGHHQGQAHITFNLYRIQS